jgi:hypothetical protein
LDSLTLTNSEALFTDAAGVSARLGISNLSLDQLKLDTPLKLALKGGVQVNQTTEGKSTALLNESPIDVTAQLLLDVEGDQFLLIQPNIKAQASGSALRPSQLLLTAGKVALRRKGLGEALDEVSIELIPKDASDASALAGSVKLAKLNHSDQHADISGAALQLNASNIRYTANTEKLVAQFGERPAARSESLKITAESSSMASKQSWNVRFDGSLGAEFGEAGVIGAVGEWNARWSSAAAPKPFAVTGVSKTGQALYRLQNRTLVARVQQGTFNVSHPQLARTAKLTGDLIGDWRFPADRPMSATHVFSGLANAGSDFKLQTQIHQVFGQAKQQSKTSTRFNASLNRMPLDEWLPPTSTQPAKPVTIEEALKSLLSELKQLDLGGVAQVDELTLGESVAKGVKIEVTP